ncbi:GPI-anchored wall transfer protein [Echinococcus granulosus]|uniref:Phosphatidylinositol-glycan biosynthesis class W protein n=1 Tax=Echinococcus granulosus TaxID=6210 RepID=W6UCC8_ECHGR|nr:GPI-anchored wall transfer protein [Echinococcus granulosus]EUB58905.1 GPI-anchored wall transfer protein [Echinococcus granulosus]
MVLVVHNILIFFRAQWILLKQNDISSSLAIVPGDRYLKSWAFLPLFAPLASSDLELSGCSFEIRRDLSIVLPCTLLSNYVLETNIILLSTVCLLQLKAPSVSPVDVTTVFPHTLSTWRRLNRTFVLIYTCVCIYAVDLPIFPRRFAKTEVTGVSLMDTGVGLIAVIVGLSNVAFLDACRRRPLQYFALLKVVARAILPCFAVGILRTVVVKALGYPEHVTEYGVHWNFFFTLASIRIGGFVVASALSRMSDFDAMNAHFVLCVLLACFQQWGVLGWAQRNHFVRSSSPTPNKSADGSSAAGIAALVRANAEGLVSLPGYLCLFIYGTAIALLLRLHLDLPVSQPVDKLKVLCVQGKETWRGDPKKVAMAVLFIGALAFLVVVACGESSVSRRLVNLPYIALQIGLLSPLMAFFICCVFDFPERKPMTPMRKDMIPLITIVSDNAMLYFLLSNLITGILNLLLDTLTLAEWQPAWFATTCQFLLLTAYTVTCPLLTLALSSLPFGRSEAKMNK